MRKKVSKLSSLIKEVKKKHPKFGSALSVFQWSLALSQLTHS